MTTPITPKSDNELVDFLLPVETDDLPNEEERRGVLMLWDRFCTMKGLLLADIEIVNGE